MIPVGTKCVIVPDGRLPAVDRFIGQTCDVVGYEVDLGRERICDICIRLDADRRDYDIRASCLIPLGHNPDTETREEKREVET